MKSKFNLIGQGWRRVIVIFSFIISAIIGFIFEGNATYSDGQVLLMSFVVCYILYWILVCIGLWVYAGFKLNK